MGEILLLFFILPVVVGLWVMVALVAWLTCDLWGERHGS